MATVKQMQKTAKKYGFELKQNTGEEDKYSLFKDGKEIKSFKYLMDLVEFFEDSEYLDSKFLYDKGSDKPEEPEEPEEDKELEASDISNDVSEIKSGEKYLDYFSESEEKDISNMEK